MSAGFDGELYLRLAVEHVLLDPVVDQGRPPWDFGVAECASALVAVDALDEELAQKIVDDSNLALVLRGRSRGMFPRPAGTGRPVAVPLPAPRAVACNQVFEQPWGRMRVHYVAFAADSTVLAITATESPPGALMQNLTQRPGGLAVNQIPLTDDTGATQIAHFIGQTGPEIRGRLVTMQPLSDSTRWIDFPDAHIQLPENDEARPTVTVESLPEMSPAVRHLWKRMEVGRHGVFYGPPVPVDITIATLVAAGDLAPEDPAIDQARAVADAFGGSGTASAALPRRWASLLARRGREGGPTGGVAIGVTTPSFDGVVVALGGLVTMPDGFEIDVVASPGGAVASSPFDIVLDTRRIAWWAEDDRGNHYLGGPNGFGGGPDQSGGTIRFTSALDPLARSLRIMPTVATARAVVDVALPGWGGKP